VPPAVLPEVGVTELTVGAGVTYVNSVLAAFVPPGVVTRTLAVPAVPEGVVQVAEVAEATLTAVHAAPPTVIPVAPVKLVPVIVTGVPPAVEPDVGEIDVTVGAEPIVKVMVCPLVRVQTYVPATSSILVKLSFWKVIVDDIGAFDVYPWETKR
jgi:hypothetical protein